MNFSNMSEKLSKIVSEKSNTFNYLKRFKYKGAFSKFIGKILSSASENVFTGFLTQRLREL